ncbi:MAG: DNA replication/repair protein RecF [Eubacteriales bacterium]|nr:DNA replication/repair protein RecF [Eubacteriales bacterium]MDD4541726.1 DNA replication/repair protein RecF [Eubacteriales bacterium]
MRLTSLKLTNFRNYGKLELSFEDGIHVFYGDNAQGKTNLLEAIFLCTCARSHRTGRDEELILHGENFYKSEVEFLTDRGLEEKVSFAYIQAEALNSSRSLRKMSYNDIEVSNISEMIGLFHAVIFAPEDLQIVKGGPGGRRRFLDLLISQISRPYFRALQRYSHLLSQRNSLLKIIRERGSANRSSSKRTDMAAGGPGLATEAKDTADDIETLELPPMTIQEELSVWDRSLAAEAAHILKQRLDYVEQISNSASLSLAYLTDSNEELSLKYKGIGGISHLQSEGEIAAIFYARLQRSAEDDVFRGSTSLGPHRDDLEVNLNEYPARTYASQGQQRSLVLSLKIAELLLLRERTGERPILLLDDVMSELDSKRRERLLEIVKDHQVFMTGTDKEHMFENNDDPTQFLTGGQERSMYFYYVKAGSVTPV